MNSLKFRITLSLAFLIFSTLSCAQKSEESGAAPESVPTAAVHDQMNMPADEAPAAAGSARQAKYAASDSPTDAQNLSAHDLGGVGLQPAPNSTARLIEYRVRLTYRTDDFMAARRNLLAIAARHGFLAQANTRAGTEPSMNSNFAVRSEKLYDALAELDVLGRLESESVETIDHTEAMELQRRKVTRETLRTQRRARYAQSPSVTDANWQARETLLSQSEDQADAAEHEQWKIRDAVAWARVEVQLLGPDQPEQIEVPVYKNALIGLANFALWALYFLLYLAPLWFVLALVYWKRTALWSLLPGKRKARTNPDA